MGSVRGQEVGKGEGSGQARVLLCSTSMRESQQVLEQMRCFRNEKDQVAAEPRALWRGRSAPQVWGYVLPHLDGCCSCRPLWSRDQAAEAHLGVTPACLPTPLPPCPLYAQGG